MVNLRCYNSVKTGCTGSLFKMRILGLVLLTAFILPACTQQDAQTQVVENIQQNVPAFYGSDISKEGLGGDFTLMRGNNRPFGLQDLRGKVVILAFGFTHCPDVCPTGLATYADVLKQLGQQAQDVAVVFVSVDPQRDTPELTDKYVRLFHEDFIGLSAKSEQDIEAVKQLYRIQAVKVPLKEGDYTVDHTAGTYLLNRNGQAIVFEPYGKTATEIADDVKILLK